MSERRAMREALFMAHARGRCLDCGIDTYEAGEYYVVRDEIWPLPVDGGMLCVGCLEKRLGRRLQRADFTDAPLNWHPRWTRDNSARLKQRQAAA
jgi:hypothetical protein